MSTLSAKDIATLYQAFPMGFQPVPILSASSARDDFTPRGCIRMKYTKTYSLDAAGGNSYMFLSPSPLTNNGAGSTSQWLGGWKGNAAAMASSPFTTAPYTPPAAPAYDPSTLVWQNGDNPYTRMSAGYGNIVEYYNGNAYPGLISSGAGPVSLCGGFFCAHVVVPYNGSCSVYNYGPTDCSQQQGILTGDCWRANPNLQVAASELGSQATIEPRRQMLNSAQFHYSPPNSAGLTGVVPDILAGASGNADKYYGFALVPDSSFNPVNSTNSTAAWTTASSDFYPSDNWCSGIMQGQGGIYFQNSGPVPITIVVELYADFCTAMDDDSQSYVSPDSYAIGTGGIAPHAIQAPVFPGCESKINCQDLLYQIALNRIPPQVRTQHMLRLLRTMIAGYMSKSRAVGSKQFQVVPMTTNARESIAKAVGNAVEDVKDDIETAVEHPIATAEKVATTVYNDVKDVAAWIAKKID
jgi:hypothetical protein